MSNKAVVQALFGEFLRARRAARPPESVGVTRPGRPRRVAGLRREEVAVLANVSTDYYARLEQGRLPPPSDDVIDSLAEALGLDHDQLTYMRELAARSHGPATSELHAERASGHTLRLLAAITDTPALAIGRVMDVLAWNPLAAQFFLDFDLLAPRERNLIRLLFLDDRMRSLYAECWSDAARSAAAMLRMRAARCPHDPRLAETVDELVRVDADFRRWWNAQEVLTHSGRRNTVYQHPVAGRLSLEWCEVRSSSQPDITIIVLTPPDDISAAQLHQLGNLPTGG